MSLTRFSSTFGIFTVLVFGCDAGRAAYDEATSLEQQGKLAEAMLKYDLVCTKAPDSKMCGPSRDRAGVVRVQLADIQMKDCQFTEAKKLLGQVLEGGASEATKKTARDRLATKDMSYGLRWEKVASVAEKRTALKEMELIAASGSIAASKAKEWVDKEGPAIVEAESARLYPLLIRAESLIGECRRLWVEGRKLDDCRLEALAKTPNNPLAALASCGGNFSGDEARKAREKLDESWKKLSVEVGDPARMANLDTRLKKACDDGDYERATLPAPSGGIAAAATRAATDAGSGTPKGLVSAWIGFLESPHEWRVQAAANGRKPLFDLVCTTVSTTFTCKDKCGENSGQLLISPESDNGMGARSDDATYVVLSFKRLCGKDTQRDVRYRLVERSDEFFRVEGPYDWQVWKVTR